MADRLISADALDNALTELRFNEDGELAHWGDRKDWCLHGNEIEKLIADAPTVDAEPRHGRWDTKYLSEDEDWSGIEHTIGRCSVCKGKIDIVGERIPYLYCPFCGAKMDEVCE